VSSHLSLVGSIPYTASKHASWESLKPYFLLHTSSYFFRQPRGPRIQHPRPRPLPRFLSITDLKRPLADTPGGALADKWATLEKRKGRSAKAEELGDVVVLITSPRMRLVNGLNLFVDG